jgi:hypothetical protein
MLSSRFELGTSKLGFFLYITVGSYNSGNSSVVEPVMRNQNRLEELTD